MADDPVPTRDAAATTEELPFREVAWSAGEQLKREMARAPETANTNIPFISFGTDIHHTVLNDVMDRFENQVFKDRHPGGTLHWRKVFIIMQATAFDEKTYSDTHKDLWLLALSVQDQGKAGESLSLHTSFAVKGGDSYVGYEVTKSKTP